MESIWFTIKWPIHHTYWSGLWTHRSTLHTEKTPSVQWFLCSFVVIVLDFSLIMRNLLLKLELNAVAIVNRPCPDIVILISCLCQFPLLHSWSHVDHFVIVMNFHWKGQQNVKWILKYCSEHRWSGWRMVCLYRSETVNLHTQSFIYIVHRPIHVSYFHFTLI